MPISTVAIVGIVGAVAAVASTGVGVMSAMAQSRAQAAAAAAGRSQAVGAAGVADYNAGVAKTQAEAIRQRGILQVKQLREKQRRLLGTQLARYGAAGIELEGSPLLVMTDSAFQGARDVATTEANAKYEASLAEANANLFTMKGGQYRQAEGLVLDGSSPILPILSSVAGGVSMANQFGLFKIPTWTGSSTETRGGQD